MSATSRSRVLRVLVVDDSAIVRDFLRDLIDDEPDMLVVGIAKNGEETLELVQKLRPDLVTMDVVMPRMDGVEATRKIMALCPTPIAIITDRPVGPSADTTFNAVSAGAVDVIAKPSRDEMTKDPTLRDAFVRKLRNVGHVSVVGIRGRKHDSSPISTSKPLVGRSDPVIPPRASLIAIGASTGGPPAIREVLAQLKPETCPPVVIVQHMSPPFLRAFATWLDGVCPLDVSLAQSGKPLEMGRAYVAPGDRHLTVSRHGMALSDTAPIHFQKPSVDVLFESVARSHGDTALGIILTGMGRDGASGLLKMHHSGACTLSQDEASSLVYGMPRVAAEMGASRLATTPGHIAQLVARVRRIPS